MQKQLVELEGEEDVFSVNENTIEMLQVVVQELVQVEVVGGETEGATGVTSPGRMTTLRVSVPPVVLDDELVQGRLHKLDTPTPTLGCTGASLGLQ